MNKFIKDINIFKWDSTILCAIVAVAIISSILIVRVGLVTVDPFAPMLDAGGQLSDVYTRLVRESEGAAELSEVVIVSFSDNRSRKNLSSLIETIASMEPKVIGLDFSISDSLEGDSLLIRTIRNTHNLVLPAVVHYDRENNLYEYNRAEHIYFANGINNSNGVINLTMHNLCYIERYFRPFYPLVNNDTILSFASEIVQHYAPLKYLKLKQRGNDFEYINYHKNVMFDTISWREFFSPEVPSLLHDRIRGRIVLIGTLSPNMDRHITPLHEDWSGVSIHAAAIDTILAEEYISIVPQWVAYLVAVLFCFLFVIMLYIARESWNNLGNLIVRIGQFVLVFFLLYIGTKLYLYDIYVDFSVVVISCSITAICFDVIFGIYKYIFSIYKKLKK